MYDKLNNLVIPENNNPSTAYGAQKKPAFISPVKAMQSPLKTATKAMIEHQAVKKTVISLAEDSIIIQAPVDERASPQPMQQSKTAIDSQRGIKGTSIRKIPASQVNLSNQPQTAAKNLQQH